MNFAARERHEAGRGPVSGLNLNMAGVVDGAENFMIETRKLLETSYQRSHSFWVECASGFSVEFSVFFLRVHE
jgi:hypothetical protein